MEKTVRWSDLDPAEKALARQMFGDLPPRKLAAALISAYEQSEIEQFGSHEAAEEHRRMANRLEEIMIAELEALEQRVKGL